MNKIPWVVCIIKLFIDNPDDEGQGGIVNIERTIEDFGLIFSFVQQPLHNFHHQILFSIF